MQIVWLIVAFNSLVLAGLGVALPLPSS